MKLHVGCGTRILEGYINIDCVNYNGVNKVLTLPEGLKEFNNNSVDEILGNHFIEHLMLNDFKKFLIESYRILRFGGKLICSFPDLYYMCKDYVKFYEENNDKFKYSITWCLFGQTESLPELHNWCYDKYTIRKYFEDAGFKINQINCDDESNYVGDYIPSQIRIIGMK